MNSNATTSHDTSSSENSSPKRTVTILTTTSNKSRNANTDHEIDIQTTPNIINKRKQAPTTQQNKTKLAKTSKTTASSITFDSNDHHDIDDNESDIQDTRKSSLLWQYATRSDDRLYATCSLCNKQISTSNWSTTSIRRHLIKIHNKLELIIPSAQAKRNSSNIKNDVKEKLHQLCVEAIIRGGLPFNTFDKPGLLKLMMEAAPGKIQNSAIFFYTKKR